MFKKEGGSLGAVLGRGNQKGLSQPPHLTLTVMFIGKE